MNIIRGLMSSTEGSITTSVYKRWYVNGTAVGCVVEPRDLV